MKYTASSLLLVAAIVALGSAWFVDRRNQYVSHLQRESEAETRFIDRLTEERITAAASRTLAFARHVIEETEDVDARRIAYWHIFNSFDQLASFYRDNELRDYSTQELANELIDLLNVDSPDDLIQLAQSQGTFPESFPNPSNSLTDTDSDHYRAYVSYVERCFHYRTVWLDKE